MQAAIKEINSFIKGIVSPEAILTYVKIVWSWILIHMVSNLKNPCTSRHFSSPDFSSWRSFVILFALIM